MLTLTIPPKKDPIARLTLLGCVALVCYAMFVSVTAPVPASAQAEGDPIIIVATPALPTPAGNPSELGMIVPTAPPIQAPIAAAPPTPQTIYIEVPGPTPQPEVVYVTVESQAQQGGTPDGGLPAVEVQPAYDPAQHPIEAAAALAAARQDLPTLQCPCDAAPLSQAPDARDYQYSRARTR